MLRTKFNKLRKFLLLLELTSWCLCFVLFSCLSFIGFLKIECPFCFSLAGGAVVAMPLLSKSGTLFVGAHSGLFFALRSSNGTIMWSRHLQGPVWASSTLDEQKGMVFVGSAAEEAPRVYALNSENGEVIWSFDQAGKIYSSPVLQYGGKIVFFCSLDHHIYALKTETGSVRLFLLVNISAFATALVIVLIYVILSGVNCFDLINPQQHRIVNINYVVTVLCPYWPQKKELTPRKTNNATTDLNCCATSRLQFLSLYTNTFTTIGNKFKKISHLRLAESL